MNLIHCIPAHQYRRAGTGLQGAIAALLVLRRMVKKPRAKGKEQKPLFSSPPPNPALKGTRGYALASFPLVLSVRAP